MNNCLIENNKSDNIIIAIRIRPFSTNELKFSNLTPLQITSSNSINIITPFESSLANNNNYKNNKSKENNNNTFYFDYIFSQNISQEEIYTTSISFLINNIFEGFNSTVFTFGETGTGKTYTMLGDSNNKGIIYLSLYDIFNYMNNNNILINNYYLSISYIEIYNENIIDLLNENNILKIVEKKNETILQNLTKIKVSDIKEAIKIIELGNNNRKIGKSLYNHHSSRSHAIIQVHLVKNYNTINYNDPNFLLQNFDKTNFGKFIFIDLAGSEKIKKNININSESYYINKSLLALSSCMQSLCKNSNNNNYIPFRDSKLTRVLKDSLSGNSKVVMIANVSPSIISFEQTMYTIKFCNNVKNLKLEPKKNMEMKVIRIKKYENIINNLKNQIIDIKNEMINKDTEEANFSENNKSNSDINNNINEINNDINIIINHFEEEIELIKNINDIEKQNSINNLNMFCNKIQNSNINNKKISNNNEKLNELYIKQYTCFNNRKKIQKIINKHMKEDNQNNYVTNNGKNLMNIYKYYVNYIENLLHDKRNYVYQNELKKKNEEINVLVNQIKLRDNYMLSAESEIKKNKGKINIINYDKYINLEEIINDPCTNNNIKSKYINYNNNNKTFKKCNSTINVKKLNIIENKNNNYNSFNLDNNNNFINNSFSINNISNNRGHNKKQSSLFSHRSYNPELLPLINKQTNLSDIKNKESLKFINEYKSKKYSLINSKSNSNLSKKILKNNNSLFNIIPPNSYRKLFKIQKKNTEKEKFQKYLNSSLSNNNILDNKSSSTLNRNNSQKLMKLFRIEKNYENKVKIILKRNILGRYRNSPYILKEENFL